MRGWACLVLFVISRNGLLVAGRGAEQQESKPIHGIDLGTLLPKKLQNLSAVVPDESDHACRQARDFASHFRVSYDIFLSIMEAAKPMFPVQYVPTTVVVLTRQPSQNIHTFCQRFRSPYVFWSSSSLLVDETAEVVLPSATSTEFDSILLHTIYRYVSGCTAVCTC